MVKIFPEVVKGLYSFYTGLSNLEVLELDGNFIERIDPGGLAHFINLSRVELDDNFLDTILEDVFDVNLPPLNLSHFEIDGNLLQCDWRVCWILNAYWLTMVDRMNTVCYGPTLLAGRRWDTITQQHLRCNGMEICMLLFHLSYRTMIYLHPIRKLRQCI